MIQLVEHIQEVLDRTSHSIASPYEHDVKAAAASIIHQSIETRTAGAGAADSVINIFVNDFQITLRCHLTQVMDMRFWMLIEGADSEIDRGAGHQQASIIAIAS